MPVAFEVARALGAPLDVLVARLARYRPAGRAPVAVKGRTAILVDDGVATGGTARAALRALRARDPLRLVLAVPVGAQESLDALGSECDEIVCLQAPEPMWAVGSWYEQFGQTSDEEVRGLLTEAAAGPAPAELAPRERTNVFDIVLLARRLDGASAWVHAQPELAALGLGYFGASTGGQQGAVRWQAEDDHGRAAGHAGRRAGAATPCALRIARPREPRCRCRPAAVRCGHE